MCMIKKISERKFPKNIRLKNYVLFIHDKEVEHPLYYKNNNILLLPIIMLINVLSIHCIKALINACSQRVETKTFTAYHQIQANIPTLHSINIFPRSLYFVHSKWIYSINFIHTNKIVMCPVTK